MIQYNSIVFASKVILDEHYREVMEKNSAYYHSNSLIHYKIGAMVGAISYFVNLPVSEWQNIRSSVIHYDGKSTIKTKGFEGLKTDIHEFFKI
jgi:hypothetical protein